MGSMAEISLVETFDDQPEKEVSSGGFLVNAKSFIACARNDWTRIV